MCKYEYLYRLVEARNLFGYFAIDSLTKSNMIIINVQITVGCRFRIAEIYLPTKCDRVFDY